MSMHEPELDGEEEDGEPGTLSGGYHSHFLEDALRRLKFSAFTSMINAYISCHRVLPSDICFNLWTASAPLLKREWKAMTSM